MTWLQEWTDVLFVHVPVSPDELLRHVPRGLELDTYDGRAYISLVGFRLKLRPAGLPFLPGLSSLLELNVRTYVRCHESPGIIFLRMYADHRVAVAAARLLTPLCYQPAKMRAARSDGGPSSFSCHSAASAGDFLAEFTISRPYQQPDPDSLAAWLVERYTLFVPTPAGLLAATVDHPRWKIADAEAHLLRQTLTDRFAASAGDCLLHHSPGVAATFHPFRSIGRPVAQTAVTPARAAVHYAAR
jgi:uncharacterized protein